MPVQRSAQMLGLFSLRAVSRYIPRSRAVPASELASGAVPAFELRQ
jgi:hypothetical protein